MPNDKFFADPVQRRPREQPSRRYDGKVDVAVDDLRSGIGDFKDGYTSGTFTRGRQGRSRHERAGRSLALAADPERPAGRSHIDARKSTIGG
jgi:hypothetical protein